MSGAAGRRLAWGIVGLTGTLTVVLFALVATNGMDLGRFVQQHYLLAVSSSVAFAATGLVVALRRPEHPVGWLLLVISVPELLSSVALEYARYGLLTAPGAALPLLSTMTVVGQLAWVPSFGLLMLLPQRFPDGRLLSARWRWVEWLGGAGMGAIMTGFAIGIWPYRGARLLGEGPPEGAIAAEAEAIVGLGIAALLLAGVLGVVSIVLRYRRADDIVRRQLLWVIVALAVSIGSAMLSTLLGDAVTTLVQSVTIPLVAVAIAVAILRYRLFEIDRIVSRTATYAVVTAVLAGIYALVAVVPAVTLDAESDLLVAVATLAAAAAFGPVRRHVQGIVDRRFNRAGYDAERVVARFGAHLRHDPDVARLRQQVASVVGRTVQPAHVSLWLRASEDGG